MRDVIDLCKIFFNVLEVSLFKEVESVIKVKFRKVIYVIWMGWRRVFSIDL